MHKKTFAFIVFLRASAAILITNTHLCELYPLKIFRGGGVLGDIVFFAVSGFCLWRPEIKCSFKHWYFKRALRCLLPVWIVTSICGVLRIYAITPSSLFYHYVFPTEYHFISSIMILYIPFYFIMKFLKGKLWLVFSLLLVIYFAVYFSCYDRSYYHIDNVHEPMIWFLFMQSMIAGALFREQMIRMDDHVSNAYVSSPIAPAIYGFAIAGILAVVYALSKVCFVRGWLPPRIQFLNQIVIYLLCLSLFKAFFGIEAFLSRCKMYGMITKPISFIAECTLEIYLVQVPIILVLTNCRSLRLRWLIGAAAISIAAYTLHRVCGVVLHQVNKLHFLRK